MISKQIGYSSALIVLVDDWVNGWLQLAPRLRAANLWSINKNENIPIRLDVVVFMKPTYRPSWVSLVCKSSKWGQRRATRWNWLLRICRIRHVIRTANRNRSAIRRQIRWVSNSVKSCRLNMESNSKLNESSWIASVAPNRRADVNWKMKCRQMAANRILWTIEARREMFWFLFKTVMNETRFDNGMEGGDCLSISSRAGHFVSDGNALVCA